MKGKGPVVTLLGGVALAATVFFANTNAVVHTAAPGRPVPVSDASATTNDPAPTGSKGAGQTPGRPAATVITKAAYAGHTAERTASIAISIHNGVAIAYLCSGTIESWLEGTAVGGKFALTGTHKGVLIGTYTANGASGTAIAGGHTFAFKVDAAHKPSGLWRASSAVRKAKVLAGWIVLPDGSQIGMVDTDGVETRAPNLDTTTHTATVDGTTLTPTPIDGESGDGF